MKELSLHCVNLWYKEPFVRFQLNWNEPSFSREESVAHNGEIKVRITAYAALVIVNVKLLDLEGSLNGQRLKMTMEPA